MYRQNVINCLHNACPKALREIWSPGTLTSLSTSAGFGIPGAGYQPVFASFMGQASEEPPGTEYSTTLLGVTGLGPSSPGQIAGLSGCSLLPTSPHNQEAGGLADFLMGA